MIKPVTIRQHMHTVHVLLRLLNEEGELERLIAWTKWKHQQTKAKRYKYIQKSYEARYERCQGKLSLLRYRFRKHYWLACGLYKISEGLSVRPQYYRGLGSQDSRGGRR